MGKAAFIRARIELALKAKAENVLHESATTPTQAVTTPHKKLLREQV